MLGWLEDVAGPNFAPAVLWTVLALVVLVIVLVIIRIVRSMTFGTFVAGGRNRRTRLAVMDAAAVDSQRRLVLVRRDEVEHLILIGGPTDVVVERDIRLHAPLRRPAGGEAVEGQQRLRPAEIPGQPRPAQPARPEQRAAQSAQPTQLPPPKAPPAAAKPTPAAARMPPVASMPASTPPRPAPPPPVNNVPPASTAAPAMPRLKPLDAPAANTGVSTTTKMRPRPEMTLEDEMNRLLGELSNKK